MKTSVERKPYNYLHSAHLTLVYHIVCLTRRCLGHHGVQVINSVRCSTLRQCLVAAGKYSPSPPSVSANRVCDALSVCIEGETYQSIAPTPTTDRFCVYVGLERALVLRARRWGVQSSLFLSVCVYIPRGYSRNARARACVCRMSVSA